MDFKQIEAFANVVKYKSFSKAADACFLTQPTISAHISTLEKEMNIKLIDRSVKDVKPTKQGELFYRFAVDMLNTREKATQSLREFESNVQGILEIQASAIPAQYLVPELLVGFSKLYPKVKYYMEQSDSQRVAEDIIDNKGEIGFTGSKSSGKLEYVPLMRDSVVLITPNNEKFRSIQRKTISVEEFISEPMLFREKGSGTRKEFEEKIEELGYSSKDLNVIARINSMETIKQAVSQGMGVSTVSKIAVNPDPHKNPFLVFELEGFQLDRSFYLAYNPKITLSPVAEVFKNFVINFFKN